MKQTKKTSIPEVTGGIVNYVDDPTDAEEYIEKLDNPVIPGSEEVNRLMGNYDLKKVAEQYVNAMT